MLFRSAKDSRKSPIPPIDECFAPDYSEGLDELAIPEPIEGRRAQRSRFEEEREVQPIPEHPFPSVEHPQQDLTPFYEYHTLNRTARSHRLERLATQLYTVSFLIIFSILGTLARLGLQWLTFYPGTPSVFPVLWANFAGTFLMGFFSEDQRLFRHEWGPGLSGTYHGQNHEEKKVEPSTAKAKHAKVKKTIPLYIGLTTGFCGSFTSFSSFCRDIFLALSNDLPTPVNHPNPGTAVPSIGTTVSRNGGYSFMAVCAVIILTISVCYSALKLGAHLAIYTDSIMPTLPFYFIRKAVDPTISLLAWGVWLAAVLMTIWQIGRAHV